MKGRTATLREYNLPVTLEEYEVPEPESGGMILKIRQASICGSDLHVWRGETSQDPTPLSGMGFGHEGFGEVYELGTSTAYDDAGQPLSIGDRVVFHFIPNATGRTARTNGFEYGAFPYFFSTFGDYYYVSAAQSVYKVPDELPDDVLPSINCAMGTAINALLVGNCSFGSNVVIFGAGGLGLTAAAAAKDMGAANVIVLDRIPERLETAREFGADHTIVVYEASTVEDRVRTVREMTDGRNADVALELVGVASLLTEGVAMLGVEGTFVEVGMIFPGTTVAFDPSTVLHERKRIVGSVMFAPDLIPKILDFLVRTKDTRPFDKLISHRFPLADINEALSRADWSQKQPSVTRVALVP